VADTVSADASAGLAMTCVARTGTVELCLADFGIACTMAGQDSNTEYQWRLSAEMRSDHWHRPHFECLAHFRMWCRQDAGAVFSANRGLQLRE